MSLLKNRSSMVLFHDEIGHRSHKVRIILEEKEISCDLEALDSLNLPKEILDVNPDGSLPLLIDRELSLYNSALIVEYLDERFPHPPLLPIYPNEKAECKLLIQRIENDWLPIIDKMMAPNVSQKEFDANKKQLAALLSGIVLILKEKPYFMSDEFTLVDCYMSAILYRLPYLGVTVPKSKNFESIKKYQDKLFSRPSFDLSLTDTERDLKYSFS